MRGGGAEMSLNVQYIETDKLKPYEKNARKHKEKDIEAIMSSIQQFGFNDPIGIWGPDCLIVEGHGRLIAAQRLGMKTVPVIRLDHLTDEQRRAYALAHNKTAELSEWNKLALDVELSMLPMFDMAAVGFFDDAAFREQNIDVGGELEVDDFSDEQFELECPECGFRFNPED